MAELAKRSRTEVFERDHEIEKAKKHVAKAAEDRRLAALAQQAKKKNTKKGKKKEEEEEEVQKVQVEVKSEQDEGPPNLHDRSQYMNTLKKTWPRPFTFGPIKFSELNVEDPDVAAAGEGRR